MSPRGIVASQSSLRDLTYSHDARAQFEITKCVIGEAAIRVSFRIIRTQIQRVLKSTDGIPIPPSII